ncbi:MAG: iron-sulfur cluster assembly protein [Chloroflexota bacterium]
MTIQTETKIDETLPSTASPSSTISQSLTPDACMEHLKRVIDPEIFQNIVDLGLVYGCAVEDDQSVTVTMTLTTPHCPMGPQIIEDVENTLKQQGATNVTVDIVWEPMWTPDAMTDELKKELGLIEEGSEDPVIELPPPPAPKKKGFLARLFGR